MELVERWNAIQVRWNVICARMMLRAKTEGDMEAFYFWQDMFVQ